MGGLAITLGGLAITVGGLTITVGGLVITVGGLPLTVVEVELVEVHSFYEVAASLGFEAGQLRVNVLTAKQKIKRYKIHMFIQFYRHVTVDNIVQII